MNSQVKCSVNRSGQLITNSKAVERYTPFLFLHVYQQFLFLSQFYFHHLDSLCKNVWLCCAVLVLVLDFNSE